eukprot:c17768_g1_i2 orf=157-2334(+)
MKRAQMIGRPRRESQPKAIVNKENESIDLPDKKRKRAGKDALEKFMPEVKNQSREVLSSLNGQQEEVSFQAVQGQAVSLQVNEQGEWEVSRMPTVDVEALLAVKITGKTKLDIKSKNEQMVEYIKKLRACIRHFIQVETACILQLQLLQNQLEEDRRSWKAAESEMKKNHYKLETDCSELKQNCSGLEEKLEVTKEQMKELLAAHEDDGNALQAAQIERGQLLDEIEKVKHSLLTANEQVKSLQDINKRLTEYNTSLHVYNTKLLSDAANATEENGRIQKEKATIMETLIALRGSAAALQSQLDTAKFTLQEETKQKNSLVRELEKQSGELQCIIEEREQCKSQIQALKEENVRTMDFRGKSAAELEIAENRAKVLEESNKCQSEQLKTLCHQLDAANCKLQTAETTMDQQRQEDAEHIKKMEELQCRLLDAELQLNEGEMVRRKLHNTIQELKGNIRVFCRVRPLLPEDEDSGSEPPVVQYPHSVELLGRTIELVQAQGQKYSFTFDKVFGPDVSQDAVFEEITQLVQSALDGYKVCIFAYGQTGSGKTYTMLGQPEQANHKGLIPRSLEQIFKSSQLLQCQGWTFKMQASMLEIYNEAIRDLLVCTKANGVDGVSNDSGNLTKHQTVKHDALGNTFVADLTLVEVTNWKEVSTLLHHATQSRSVGKTTMNERSSRSHCVFTLRISGVNESTEQQVHGVLNLVDLAGSERLSRSGSTGNQQEPG